MKNFLLIVLLTLSFNSYAQDTEITDEQKIKKVINDFFDSLAKKDTLLLKSTSVMKGQIWRIYNDENPKRSNMRYFKDNVDLLSTWPVVEEIALDYEINAHRGIATAWVPYKFLVNNQFSHCGIDVFTLLKIEGIWKIINLTYSVEKKDCEELMSKN